MTVGSLFAGIGGLDLGLERAGMQVKWQVENDPYCIRVLEKHWPSVKRYGDIKQIEWAEVEPVDLICGGFPCQPISVAGARKGDKDERWLWPEFLRAIREIRPRYALVENVPGLLSTDDGRLARGVFGDLAEIGYDAEWGIVSATDVGALHLRRRVFIVAYPQSDIRSTSRHGRSLSSDGGDSLLADSKVPEWPRAGNSRAGRLGSTNRRSSSDDDGGRCSWPQISIFSGEARPSNNLSIGNGQWAVEPDVGRVANGVPSRVDRLKSLGNAVVPQVAEYIGKLIITFDGGN